MSNEASRDGLWRCEDALRLVMQQCSAILPQPHAETVDLQQAQGRVLVEAVVADRDQPPFDRSTRDGFAVRAEEAGSGVWLRQQGTLRAGEVWHGNPLASGECIEIMTGAPLPAGADSVVMVEHVEHERNAVRLAAGRAITAGENIVVRAGEASAGDILIERRVRLSAAEIALAASVGYAELEVFRKPRVAILATGDELVEVTEKPAPYQIRNSNSYGIAALIESAGGEAWRIPLVADNEEALRDAIAESREADLLVLSGGVSAGKYDFVEAALAAYNAEFYFTGVKMQPGKPVVFGSIPAKDDLPKQLFFGLPGNPVSTQVTSLLFVQPVVRALAGEKEIAPRFAAASLEREMKVKPGLTRFLPALIKSSLTQTTVSLTGWQGSGDLTANSRANCYAVIPDHVDILAAGSTVQVLLR